MQREGIECYQTFIRGLLDITDNIVDGKRRAAAATSCAATATIRTWSSRPTRARRRSPTSPTRISAEYGFWLGDAFASGGSAGYDHKKMGITARGGWECVKRHFRELGIDTQSQDFTVAGIGDMAGDVFGNGMLLSPHIRLVAAFNHRHIFLDPNPDRGRELRRARAPVQAAALELGRLRPQADLEGRRRVPAQRQVDPAVAAGAGAARARRASRRRRSKLIRAILRMPVDLLWNGGIGTYVKAQRRDARRRRRPRQRRACASTAASCAARSSAKAATSACRSAAASSTRSRGGRLNTDFIDNSAGVDSSDHEVNIKILLNDADAARGKLTRAARNKLLVEMTDEVARAGAARQLPAEPGDQSCSKRARPSGSPSTRT